MIELPILEELVLSSNQLLSFDCALRCPRLKFLGLKSNRLIDVRINCFSSKTSASSLISFLPSLEEVDLSFNTDLKESFNILELKKNYSFSQIQNTIQLFPRVSTFSFEPRLLKR
jgi:Leucine-rich repeat (LRR) protein